MKSSVEIRVRGPVRIEEADRLGLRASVAPADTVLRGTVADRPALHGVLDRLRAHGLELIEVRRLPGGAT
jgi:hypothetical protein